MVKADPGSATLLLAEDLGWYLCARTHCLDCCF